MRIKKPRQFDQQKQYKPGERAIYRDMVIIAESACNDSDYMANVIKMVINRTADTEESKTAMLEHIKQLPKVEHKKV